MNEKVWRCECGSEVLGVSFYTWRENPPDWFVEIYKTPGVGRFSWRLRKALGLLLGREVVIDAVSLHRGDVLELLDWFGQTINETELRTANQSEPVS